MFSDSGKVLLIISFFELSKIIAKKTLNKI
jgi:hypothetical protein